MTFNVFEGARRISLLVVVVAIVSTLFSLVTYKPISRDVKYFVYSPNGGFAKMQLECPYDSVSEYFKSSIGTGQSVYVSLCFLSMPFGEKGVRLIPYTIDNNGMVWGAASSSNEVRAYTERRKSQFRIPHGDETEILRDMSRDYRDYWLSGLGYLSAGLAIFAVFVWTVGWIVRGFFGIPRGYDRKPESAED